MKNETRCETNPLFGLAIGLAVVLGGCGNADNSVKSSSASGTTSAPTVKKVDRDMLGAFGQMPKSADNPKNATNPDKVALGRQLYFDTRLSKNQDISCNSCHGLATFGVDNKPVSEGHKKQLGGRSAPTVYAAALHFRQFWDGRAEDVEEQATGPVLNPIEMAMPNEAAVVAVLKSIPEYEAAFKKAFPSDADPVTLANVGKAIGAFERTLLVSGRWDKYLAGDETALSDDEKAGLATFLDVGCQTCHMGPAVGGGSYQKLGLIKPWGESKDQGRFEVTKNDADKMMFKVPSLRNIAKTGPYFHDGSIKDLETAVEKMAHHQRGRDLTPAEIKSIVTFLQALTAEPPADMVKPPELPKSTDKTPKADPN
ncbi:MAG: cytochrome c peroxidase [Polyangiaceae bacterium]